MRYRVTSLADLASYRVTYCLEPMRVCATFICTASLEAAWVCLQSQQSIFEEKYHKNILLFRMGLDADDLFSCLEVLSTVAAGIFSGSAIYVNVVEHPARMTLTDTKSCHRQWMESFDRAKVLQSCLALVSTVSGVGAYYCNPKKGLPFLIGGGIVALVFPYTLFILKPNSIDPIYDKDITSKKSESVIRDTIVKWNNYHMVRSFIGMPVFVGYVVYMASNHKKFW